MFHLSSHPSCCKDFWESEIPDSSQRHPAPCCHCGLMWPLPCCAAPGLVPAGAFLHSTTTFGVCWPGPQPRGCFSAAITCDTPLLWGLQKDFLVLLAFPMLCGPVPSGERGAPLGSFAMSHLVRHRNILHWAASSQTCCSSLAHSPNPSCKLNCPMALGPSPHAQPALQWERLLSPAVDIMTPIRGLWWVPAVS